MISEKMISEKKECHGWLRRAESKLLLPLLHTLVEKGRGEEVSTLSTAPMRVKVSERACA
jgi:hypothetical protein